MTISVVIPAFNEERLIGQSLQQVEKACGAFVERGWHTDVIVCDNNSTDATTETARKNGARVVFEAINQISRARNTGAAAAKGDWLLFIDADSYPSRALLEDVADLIAGGGCLAGGATVQMDCNEPIASWLIRTWNRLSRFRRLMAGSFIFCEAEAFRVVGGFSTQLFVAEEIDLSRRLQRLARTRGKKIVIIHRHSITTSPRKLHLYRKREYALFMAKLVFSLGWATRKRSACVPWYDGRR